MRVILDPTLWPLTLHGYFFGLQKMTFLAEKPQISCCLTAEAKRSTRIIHWIGQESRGTGGDAFQTSKSLRWALLLGHPAH